MGGGRQGELYKVKQGVKPDSCHGSKFLLELIVGEVNLVFWCEVGRGEGATTCLHMRYLGLKLSLTLPPLTLGHFSSITILLSYFSITVTKYHDQGNV